MLIFLWQFLFHIAFETAKEVWPQDLMELRHAGLRLVIYGA